MSEQRKAIELANQYESERLWDDVICSEWINSAAKELRRLDAENAEITHQRNMLGDAIYKAAVDLGIYNPDVGLNGAQLLMAIGDIVDSYKFIEKERDALRAQLEGLELSVAWGHNPFQNAQLAQGEPVNVAEIIKQDTRKKFSSWLWAVAECYEDTEHRKVLIDIATGFQTLITGLGNTDTAPQQAPVDERKAFELAAKNDGHDLSRKATGEYSNIYLESAWAGWQQRAALKPAVPEGYQLVPALAADWPLAVGVKRLLRELSLNAHPRDVVYFTLIDMLAAAKDGES